jgi:hypothetical protein
MTDFQIAPYCSERFEGVKSLWQEAFPDDPPWNAAEIAIPAKLAVQPDLFFVALDGDQVVGSIMAGYDGHRGWLYASEFSPPPWRRGSTRAWSGGASSISVVRQDHKRRRCRILQAARVCDRGAHKHGEANIQRTPTSKLTHYPPHSRRDRGAIPRARDGAAERGVSERFPGCFSDTATVTATNPTRSILGIR